eukprot:CAMPEP_0202453998 /NCGR_PEP_ID=MMETSP1360-20130828/11842_1 /ASSEMBLY_ACC=CAM_ASM_000848 /TAXON_ID=515479 /ORGANISM="Licmophora paradoxa, Strain CCMP2313" /LENGTH=64 /DNA_ID=CAMNT_0049073211 /DNA_START=1097 /DNA_END=1291 /DNA_ORIENTATION=+
MGCMGSKQGLNTVDDSMHVLVKKPVNNGETAGFVPRPEHPLMKKKQEPVVADETDGVEIPDNGT